MESQPREIQRYVTPDGKIPFDQWYESLSDAKTQYKIDARIERIALGNLGDYRFVGAGVYEFRINYGTWLSPLLWTNRIKNCVIAVWGR